MVYSQRPAEPVAEQIFQQMAAQGQSFFNASGDNDAYTGLINFPGDSPYITQVGGTTLTTSGPGGAWVSETVWNWGDGIGSGGGISTQYPIPGWQTNISMAANQGSTTMRNMPDVALTADNVYVRADGTELQCGRHQLRGAVVGGLYGLGQSTGGGHRRTGGRLHQPGRGCHRQRPQLHRLFPRHHHRQQHHPRQPTKFYAVAGYDLCTGWGTPNGQKLINALANPEPLQITPTTGFTSIGGVGGPFTVTSENSR